MCSLCSFSYLSIQVSLVSFSVLNTSLRLYIFSLSCFLVISNYLSNPAFFISKTSIYLSLSITFLSNSSISSTLLVFISFLSLIISFKFLFFYISSCNLISVSCLTLFVRCNFSIASSKSLLQVEYYSLTFSYYIVNVPCFKSNSS